MAKYKLSAKLRKGKTAGKRPPKAKVPKSSMGKAPKIKATKVAKPPMPRTAPVGERSSGYGIF